MTGLRTNIVLRHIRDFAAAECINRLSDRELLERFALERDEAAFAALVRRHGPLVLGVCRRVLHNRHDAEDAFQATFLALARQAATAGRQALLGTWLYRVAYRTAMRLRSQSAARRQREDQVPPPSPSDPLAEVTGRELMTVLDEELHRLPERLRAPLVLCYLEGKTRDEAARELGWSLGTLKRRLEQGRATLRSRVTGRGISLTALLAVGAGAVTVPAALAASSVRTALGNATAVPVAVAALAREALRAAPGRTTKAVGALLLAFGLVAGLVASQTPPAVRGDSPRAEAEAAKPPAPRPAEAAPSRKGELIVTGSVVGADGKPVAGAKVAVIGLTESFYRGHVGLRGHETLSRGETDEEGRFRLVCVAESAIRRPVRQVLASAPGHGLGWLLMEGDDTTKMDIKLPVEQVIRGRLLDLQGQAAGGVKLHVAEVAPSVGLGNGSSSGSSMGGAFRPPLTGSSSTLGGPSPALILPFGPEFATQPAKLEAWPPGLITDEDGRFVLRGVGKNQVVQLLVTDERFSRQHLTIRTTANDKPEAVARVLEPAHWLEGKVIGEDTGKPIGRKVLLEVHSGDSRFQTWTDENGVFRINCPLGRVAGPSNVPRRIPIAIEPYPPDGSPYLTRVKFIDEWPKGKVKHEIEVPLPRGVVVRGKVMDDTAKPVAGAVLTYYIRQDNPIANFPILSWRRHPGEFVQTKEDGTFEATVYPGKGTLLAKGPTRDYVLQRLDTKELTQGQPRGAPLYTHASAALDLKADAEAPEVALKLRRGVTLKGRVLDPDGKPVKSAVLYYPLGLRDNADRAYFFHYGLEPITVKDGAFVLTGLDPMAKLPIVVLDRTNECGARTEVSGEEVIVKLQPCAKVKARFVDRDGKPARGHGLGLQFVLDAEALSYLSQDELLGGKWEHSDAEGRVTVRGLIPGVTYRYFDGKKTRDITAESGKTHDLSDVGLPSFGGGGSGGSSD
jgi:RNA polymerase sigma factor (sigma-70 family)